MKYRRLTAAGLSMNRANGSSRRLATFRCASGGGATKKWGAHAVGASTAAGCCRSLTTRATATGEAPSLWRRIASVPRTYPFAFGVVFSGAKTSAADLLVQRYIEQKREIEWKRNLAFASFGFIYLGGVQYFIYVPLFSRLFPTAKGFADKTLHQKLKDPRGWLTVLKQTVLDQFVHHPLLYFPCFYATKVMVTEGLNPYSALNKGVTTFQSNAKEDLAALWKIWVPATLINFAFSPMWFRIPFVACTSMLWTCILSAMRGGSYQVELEFDEAVAAGQEEQTSEAHQLAETEVEKAGSKLSSSAAGVKAVEGLRNMIQRRMYDYNHPHNTKFVLTVSGEDRAGVLAMLGAQIHKHGGNVAEVKQINIADNFALMMAVSIKHEDAHYLNTQFHSMQGLFAHVSSVELLTATEQHAAAEGRVLSFDLFGPDSPGIVSSMMEAFNEGGVSVRSIQSELFDEAQPHFKMSGELLLPTGMDVEEALPQLRAALASRADDFGLTCNITQAHHSSTSN